MRAPITVNYVPDGNDWTVTVAAEDTTRKTTAPGLIAARDQADQLVEQITPDQQRRTVVHLLDGDAFAFTTSYLHARLGLAREVSPKAEPAFGDHSGDAEQPNSSVKTPSRLLAVLTEQPDTAEQQADPST